MTKFDSEIYNVIYNYFDTFYSSKNKKIFDLKQYFKQHLKTLIKVERDQGKYELISLLVKYLDIEETKAILEDILKEEEGKKWLQCSLRRDDPLICWIFFHSKGESDGYGIPFVKSLIENSGLSTEEWMSQEGGAALFSVTRNSNEKHTNSDEEYKKGIRKKIKFLIACGVDIGSHTAVYTVSNGKVASQLKTVFDITTIEPEIKKLVLLKGLKYLFKQKQDHNTMRRIRFLLKNGADPCAIDKTTKTPLINLAPLEARVTVLKFMNQRTLDKNGKPWKVGVRKNVIEKVIKDSNDDNEEVIHALLETALIDLDDEVRKKAISNLIMLSKNANEKVSAIVGKSLTRETDENKKLALVSILDNLLYSKNEKLILAILKIQGEKETSQTVKKKIGEVLSRCQQKNEKKQEISIKQFNSKKNYQKGALSGIFNILNFNLDFWGESNVLEKLKKEEPEPKKEEPGSPSSLLPEETKKNK